MKKKFSYFPKLSEKKLFLASPGDVAYLRGMALDVVNELEGRSGRGLAMFAWEIDLVESVFNDGAPIQEQIHLPSDPLCLGLVAFFGERIGQSLADNFPMENISRYLAAKGSPGLVHPWNPKALESGGFPLTGSTFEVLCAIASNEDRKAAGQKLSPVFLRFVGSSECLETSNPSSADWGNQKLRTHITETFKNDYEGLITHLEDVVEQLKCLRNFSLFLKSVVGDVHFSSDEEKIEKDFRKFVRENFFLTNNPTDINPFLGLKSYGVKDHNAYFGRADEQKTAIESIENVFSDDTRRNFYWIDGSSGAGKSSFLRAGIIGGLTQSLRVVGNYSYVVCRPNELLSKSSGTIKGSHCPLSVFFKLALGALTESQSDKSPSEIEISESIQKFGRRKLKNRAAFAAKELDRYLNNMNGDKILDPPTRLIIGIDQFEEIVDMLEDEVLGSNWELFIQFIDCVSKNRHVVVIATMRQERFEKMKRDSLLMDIEASTRRQGIHITFPNGAELKKIITKPFDDFGRAQLDNTLVDKLVENIRDYSRLHTVEKVGSVLPLVSLTLLRIHEFVARPLIKDRFKDNDPELVDNFDSAAADSDSDYLPGGKVSITLDDAEGYIELEGVIANLAAQALKAAEKKQALKADETPVDSLLRLLVRWSGSDDKQFSLDTISIPTANSERELSLALLEHRLLVDEGDDKVKLVHETVLQHWPEARDFMERERPLHENARELMTLAKVWSRVGSAKAAIEIGLNEHSDVAFRILLLWSARFHKYFYNELDPDDEILRDYCLALLKEYCQPESFVGSEAKKTSHLHLATFYGRKDIVKKMLEANKSNVENIINMRGSTGRTPLTAPCFMDDVSIIKLLLKYGADPNADEKEGWRPLHAVAVGGSVEIFECLIKKGADIKLLTDGHLHHPIHLAARKGNKDLVLHLKDKLKIDLNLPDRSGDTPISHAILGDGADMIRFLHSLGADLYLKQKSEAFNVFYLHQAARQGSVRSIEALLDLGMSADEKLLNGWTALHLAAFNNFPASVGLLADKMSDVNVETINEWEIKNNKEVRKILDEGKPHTKGGWTALHIAAEKGHLKVIKTLAERNVDLKAVTSDEDTTLHLAIQAGHDEVAIFLSGISDILEMRNAGGYTPLQLAVFKGKLALASELARQGASVSATVNYSSLKDEDLVTILHTSAFKNEETLTKLIIDHEKDITRKTANGRTALHISAISGSERVLDYHLKKWTGDIFEQDIDGYNCFDAACLGGSLECVKLIASKIQNDELLVKNCPDALHYAAQSGRARLVAELIDRGFSPSAYNSDGRTPLHISAQEGHSNVLKELLSRGANPRLHWNDNIGVTSFEIAVECGATEVLEILLETIDDDKFNVETLLFSALDYLQFDCVAVLLEYLEKRDFPCPKTGITISARYHAMVADMNNFVPGANLKSDRLEKIFKPNIEVPSKKQEREAASDQKKVSGTETITQSRQFGLAGDLYPLFEKAPPHIWQKLKPVEVSKFVGRVNPIADKYDLNLDTIEMYKRSLPWYEDVELYYIHDTSLENQKLRFYYLQRGDNLYWLNGTSPPIHELNAKAPIKLNEKNVADYCRFFCFFVRGKDGPFYVCEDARDPLIPGSTDSVVVDVIESTARPIFFEGVNEKGNFILDAVIFYSNAMFIANFSIQPTGMVDMLDDEPISADLPVKIDFPIS